MSSIHPWHNVSPGHDIPKTVTAIIEIPKGSKGKYEIYAYFSKINGRSSHTEITVNDGGEEKPLMLETSSIKELGLSSGEWVKVGIFTLPAGRTSYLEISNRGADGIITADAVIWKLVEGK